MKSEKDYWKTTPEIWAKLKPAARRYRKEPTPAEQHLWERLRGKRIDGFKFRRQHAIDKFIVDFYCREMKLIVEVDGPIHAYTAEHDSIRAESLDDLGFRVIRFSNDEVLTATDQVIAEIQKYLHETKAPSPIRGGDQGER